MLTEQRPTGVIGPRLEAATEHARLLDLAALRAALWPFLATRVGFLLIGLAAPVLFNDNATRRPPVPTGTGWMRWDVQWFVGIAQHGYSFHLGNYSATAFFPLYPLLIRAVSASGLDAGLAGALIANLAFLGALYYVQRLVRLDWPGTVAARTLWLLALFPTALVFFIPYTESLYLLLAVLTLWYLRRRRWLAAGLAGALGALTRQTGLVLLLPYLVEWAGARLDTPTDAEQRRASLRELLPAALMPLAVAAHLAYLWHVTGSPTTFMRAQGAWHRRLDWPWAGIVATVQRWGLPDTSNIQHVHMVLELGSVLLFLGLLAVGWHRVRLSYSVYAGVVWLAALLSPAVADSSRNPLMSSSRFALSVFPSFIVLALLLRRPGPYQAWLTASTLLLGFFAAFFVVGGWVA